MKFWDSSAILPLIVKEASSTQMLKIYKSDRSMLVWWATEIECISALARLELGKSISAPSMDKAESRLNDLKSTWYEIQPLMLVRQKAARLLRVHKLRAADSLQLASAIIASQDRPSGLDFVCLDERLNHAAKLEGFNILNH